MNFKMDYSVTGPDGARYNPHNWYENANRNRESSLTMLPHLQSAPIDLITVLSKGNNTIRNILAKLTFHHSQDGIVTELNSHRRRSLKGFAEENTILYDPVRTELGT